MKLLMLFWIASAAFVLYRSRHTLLTDLKKLNSKLIVALLLAPIILIVKIVREIYLCCVDKQHWEYWKSLSFFPSWLFEPEEQDGQ